MTPNEQRVPTSVLVELVALAEIGQSSRRGALLYAQDQRKSAILPEERDAAQFAVDAAQLLVTKGADVLAQARAFLRPATVAEALDHTRVLFGYCALHNFGGEMPCPSCDACKCGHARSVHVFQDMGAAVSSLWKRGSCISCRCALFASAPKQEAGRVVPAPAGDGLSAGEGA